MIRNGALPNPVYGLSAESLEKLSDGFNGYIGPEINFMDLLADDILRNGRKCDKTAFGAVFWGHGYSDVWDEATAKENPMTAETRAERVVSLMFGSVAAIDRTVTGTPYTQSHPRYINDIGILTRHMPSPSNLDFTLIRSCRDYITGEISITGLKQDKETDQISAVQEKIVTVSRPRTYKQTYFKDCNPVLVGEAAVLERVEARDIGVSRAKVSEFIGLLASAYESA